MSPDRRDEDPIVPRLPEAPKGEPIPPQSTPDTEGHEPASAEPERGLVLERVFDRQARDAPQAPPLSGSETDRIYTPAMLPAPERPAQSKPLPFAEPEPSTVKLVVTDRPQITLVVTDDATPVKQATSQATGYQTTYQLKQGLFGERLATEALAADGHKILMCKREITGTNQPGFDIVTLKDGVVWLIDNKAFTTGRNISSVSALTTNYEANVADALTELKEHAAATAGDPQLKFIHDAYSEAVEHLENGECQKATTSFALAPDGKHTTGVTGRIGGQDIVHLPLEGFEHPPLDPVFGTESQPAGPQHGSSTSGAIIPPTAPPSGPGGTPSGGR